MPRARGSRVAATVATLVAVAMPVALSAALWIGNAFACANLATISLSSAFGHPGDKIVIIGTSFPVPRATSTTLPTPVVVRWKSIDGEIIASAVPDRTGTISATFTVPQSEPGNVVIVAVQRRGLVDAAAPDTPPTVFIDEVGTPARATFRILAKGEFAPTPTPFSPVLASGGDSGSTALIVLMVLFGAVALSLFAGGVIAFLHQVRTRRPEPQPVWPPY